MQRPTWSHVVLAGVVGTLLQYPIACAHRKAETRPPDNGNAANASSLVQSARGLLPEPSFAYAGTAQGAVSIADVAKVKLGELSESGGAATGPSGNHDMLDGVTLEPLDPAAHRQLDVPPDVQSGVVVSGIEPGSTAADSGLVPGDVILRVVRKGMSLFLIGRK